MIGILLALGIVVLVLWIAAKLVKGTAREVKSYGRTVSYFTAPRASQPRKTAFMATDAEMANFYGYEAKS
jgi:hypothetical protein